MDRIKSIRDTYNEALNKYCEKNQISFTSLQKLLDAEKTKKLIKRIALMQQNIDKEIENALEKDKPLNNEN